MTQPTGESATRAATGMTLSAHAAAAPERTALVTESGDRTFGGLNARVNQLARALRRRGLKAGDAVALLCSNRPEFVEVYAACQRAGLRVTPVNWHLTAGEVGYIVDDCEARVFVADARFPDTAGEAAQQAPGLEQRLAVGGAIDGFDSYDEVLERESEAELDAPVLGSTMMYTSGTTGRPKGVFRRSQPGAGHLLGPLRESAAFVPGEDMALCTGPLYHAAPLALNLNFPLANGVGVVLMDGFEAESTLELVARHRVTHTHMVATMFHRMLALPDAVRSVHRTDSLRWVLHGAAPCPVHVKHAMLDWLGPVLFEYYAATEGGGFFIGPEDWRRKPGSVGHVREQTVHVLDEAGEPASIGEVGTVYFGAPDKGRFEYFKDPEKTASAYRGDLFTMGDHGYLDNEGFLFLTGRSAELIISGGVNIYPAEVDDVLLMHPGVADAATVGVPNEEWGEEVKSVVELEPGREPGEALARELIEHCRAHLAGYKCPRSIDFSDDLPRLPTGKIQRRKVRERYLPGAPGPS